MRSELVQAIVVLIRRLCVWTPAVLVLIVGCGSRDKSAAFRSVKADVAPTSESRADMAGRLPSPRDESKKADERTDESDSSLAPREGDAPPAAEKIVRKIIYTATVNLVVENFDSVPSEVESLIKEFDGYIASAHISGSTGTPRNGRWKLRVPVARFDEFLERTRKLGEVRSVRTDSSDVTDEFYDVATRIRIKKAQEEQLLKLLKETGNLKEKLEVDKRLDNVREEIERFEGRLRVLSHLTSLTTVELHVDEIKNYVPEEAVTFGVRAQRAFHGSVGGLVDFGQDAAIFAVELVPWLPLILVLCGVAWFGVRRLRRRWRGG